MAISAHSQSFQCRAHDQTAHSAVNLVLNRTSNGQRNSTCCSSRSSASSSKTNVVETGNDAAPKVAHRQYGLEIVGPGAHRGNFFWAGSQSASDVPRRSSLALLVSRGRFDPRGWNLRGSRRCGVFWSAISKARSSIAHPSPYVDDQHHACSTNSARVRFGPNDRGGTARCRSDVPLRQARSRKLPQHTILE
jgi:hypothetical protein